MSVIEEPDVGNLQVCEGHGLSHKGINMMNERKGESHMSTRQHLSGMSFKPLNILLINRTFVHNVIND